METEEFSYCLLIREHGIKEMVFGDEQRCVAFLLTISDALIRGFGALNSGGSS